MTSEIRTNSLKSRAGLSTVTLTDSGPMFSGITTFVDNSAFSVGTGGTIHAPATNVMALGTNNIDAIKIDSSGNVNVTGILTASSFSGGVSLANGSNDRVVTATGAAALNGEANMTFDGSLLKIASRAVIGNGSEYQIPSRNNTSSYTPQFQITGAWNNPTHGGTLALNGRSDYPILWLNSGASYQNNSGAGVITWSIKDGAGNYCNTAEIRSFVDGTPGNNNSPGDLSFRTTPAGTCQPTEAFRITSAGNHIISNSIGVNVPLPQITKGIQISKGGGSGGVSNTYSVANQYLHLGSAEYNSSGGLFSIGFGYINSGGSTAPYAPAYLGFKETSTSNHTRGDLVFATRDSTSVAEPTVRLSIKSNGAIDIPSTSYISGSIAINASTQQLTNGLQVSKGGGSGGAPTSYSLANEYLHVGAGEYATNGLYLMGFGYVTGCTNSPAYIGFKTNSTSSCTRGDLIFATRSGTADAAPNERLRIDSNGDLGLGIAAVPQDSGARTLHIHDTDTGSGARAAIRLTHGSSGSSASNGAFIGFDNNPDFYIYNQESGRLRFGVGGTEKLRINSSGKLATAYSTSQLSDYAQLDVVGNDGTGGVIRAFMDVNSTAVGYSCLELRHVGARPGQDAYGARFKNSGGGVCGSIFLGQSTAAFNTSSDYRLKENVVAISDGITRLKTLKPYRFNWIEEKGQPKVDGFFAHEVTAVPEAIKGTKDQVDENGNPEYQQIDHSKLVPLITAALQEAIAKIENLEQDNIALRARVTNLEGN